MSKKRVSKQKRIFILKILILPLVFAAILVYFTYMQIQTFPTKTDDAPVLETQNNGDQKENEKLDEPNKPPENEEAPAKEEDATVQPSIPGGQWWEYPDKILPVTRSGNDLLVLVNKKYKLPSSYAPTNLVSAGNAGIRLKGNGNYLVRDILTADLKAMNDTAKAAGVDLSVVSAYRSYSTQVSTYQYWVDYNGGDTAAADTVSARPGHSQHQLGTAIDFSSNEINDRLGDEFTNTKAEKWLGVNAWKYGFVLSYPKNSESTTGYSYESWHYRYIGKANAQEWKSSEKILEIWLREKNGL